MNNIDQTFPRATEPGRTAASIGDSSRSQRRNRTRLIVGIVLFIAAALLIWHFAAVLFSKKDEAPPPPPVKTALARQQDVAIVNQAIGTVVATATVNLTAQVTGKLTAVHFEEGQIVHKGDLLFKIDPAPFQSALEQAEGQLAKDQAQLVSLNADADRYTTLVAENSASVQQRDQAVAAAKSGAAMVKSDMAAVDIATQNLGYTDIRAPIDGKTGPILVQAGNLVMANGTNPLVVIAQLQPIKVSFFLPQSDLPDIQNQIRAGALATVVPMPGAPGNSERAMANFVSNIVDPATRTIELRATFANTDLRLVPGQSVHVAATLKTIPRAIVVPRDAVNIGPDRSFVYVIGANSTAVAKTVTVLNDDDTDDAIAGDVKAGDQVIVEGQLRVDPGTVVSVANGNAPAAAAPAPRTP